MYPPPIEGYSIVVIMPTHFDIQLFHQLLDFQMSVFLDPFLGFGYGIGEFLATGLAFQYWLAFQAFANIVREPQKIETPVAFT